MRAISLLLAMVMVSLVNCAEKQKGDTLHKFNHAVPRHSEVCVAATEEDIAALFDRYNASLLTGDVHKVSANYASTSVLLPTMSSRPRLTVYDKEDYYRHFLENQPVGHIDSQDAREIEIDCNTAIDTGLYSFTFQKTGASVKARYTFTYKWDGKQWLITSHHSSALPTVDAPPAHVHQAVAQHAEECEEASEEQIAALFDRWNRALQSGDVHKVAANYAPTSLLLPTVSSRPRFTAIDKEDYFHHFMENRPVGRIDSREIEIDCNTAIDTGLYSFTFQKTGATVKARYTFTYKWDGKQWLITSHHSSAVPVNE
ncbi:MAG TPA: SgcJ/EcaC family oxidoreductase [Nitrospira sp.]|nr:SgcJ/EcaC family oxidoreductase [Nitrospira sp.]